MQIPVRHPDFDRVECESRITEARAYAPECSTVDRGRSSAPRARALGATCRLGARALLRGLLGGTALACIMVLCLRSPLAARPLGALPLPMLVTAAQSAVPASAARPARAGRVLESPPDPAPALVSAFVDGSTHDEGIYHHSGEFWATAIDMHVRGRGIDFVWQRKYRSRFGPSTAHGNGWDYSYNLWIEPVGSNVRVHDGNTRVDLFVPIVGGRYAALQHFCEGEFLPGGEFRITFADLSTWSFHAPGAAPWSGRLHQIADRYGNAMGFGYDGLGRLNAISDTLGRSYQIAYDAGGRIASLTDFTGRSVTYAYDANGDLRSATSPAVTGTPTGNDFPVGKTTTYTYSSGTGSARLDHNLLTIVDPSGRLLLSNEYSTTLDPTRVEFDRLVRQQRGMANDTFEIAYMPLGIAALPVSGPLPESLLAIVNDRVGNVRELGFDARGRKLRERVYTGRAINGIPTTATTNRPTGKLRADDPDWFETRWEYDEDSLVTRIVHPAGNVTRYVRVSALDPFAPTRARGNLRELRREPGTHAMPADQVAGTVELFEYESSIAGVLGTNLLRRYTDARGNVTQHFHDAQGNRIQTIGRITSIVDDFTYDASGRLTSHSAPIDGNGVRRRDDFLWYGPADGPQNGYLRARVDDAAGHALTTTWTYDARGQVVGRTDPRGNDVQLVRNALDQIVLERSPLLAGPSSARQETRYFYDADDRLAVIERDNRDETGALSPMNPAYRTEFGFGTRGELIHRSDEVDALRSAVTEFAWDGNRNLVLVRRGEAVNGQQPANTITYAYDERDLEWRMTRAAGSAEASTDQSDYDANANPRAIRRGVEGVPQVETLGHDALDRLRTRVDAHGNVTTYHYDPNGNLGGNIGGDAAPVPHPFAEETQGQLVDVPGSAGNRRLAEAQHVYDALDRLVRTDVRHFDTQTQAPIGDGIARTTQSWTGNSLLATRTLDGGATHTTSYTYDALGRLVQRLDAEGNRRSWTYDAAGNAVSVVDIDRSDTGAPDQTFVASYGYDALDRAILAVDGVGMPRAWAWDGLGRLVRETDRGGWISRFEYDGLDRLVRIGHDMDGNGFDTDPSDVVLTQSFDDSSRRVARTDGTFQTTRFAWDALDRHIGTLHADGTLEQNGSGMSWAPATPAPNLAGFVSGYDARDNLFEHTDANGTRATRVYDLLDRATSVSVLRAPGVGGTTSETWQFDGLSRFVRADVFVDHVVAPASSTLVRGSSTTSGYDSLSNVLRETRTINGGPARTVLATFDGESNLTQLMHPAGSSPLLRLSWSYDGVSRPTNVRDVTGAPLTLATLAYVGPDRLERVDRLNNTRTTHAYDGIGGIPNPPGDLGFGREIERLHVRMPSGSLLAGSSLRWSQAGMKLDSTDRLSFAPTNYVHDALDRLTHSSSPFAGPIDYALDASGSRTLVNGGAMPGSYSSNPVHAYTSTPFDARGNDASGNHVFRSTPPRNCVYDYENRLIETDDGANVVRYRYDGLGRCVEKTNGATIERYDYDPLGRLIEVQNGANVTQSQFVHADDSGTPFLWKRAGTRYDLHTDDVGSVVCVTDPAGNVAASYRYSDFGEHVAGGASTGQGGNLASMALSDEDFHCSLPPSQRADDFTLPQASVITALRWWGGHDCAPAPFTENFILEIRDDAGGVPGPTQQLFQYVPNVARVTTGALLPGTIGSVPEYEYSVALNVPFHALATVRYWLCIRRAGDGAAPGWSWESSSQGNGSHAQSVNFGPWSISSGNCAFSLELAGPAIPLSPFLFHGNWYDADSGLYRIGSRAYEPAVGAFLQRDPDLPLSWFATGGHGYTFALNAPTSVSAAKHALGVVFGQTVTGPKEAKAAKDAQAAADKAKSAKVESTKAAGIQFDNDKQAAANKITKAKADLDKASAELSAADKIKVPAEMELKEKQDKKKALGEKVVNAAAAHAKAQDDYRKKYGTLP